VNTIPDGNGTVLIVEGDEGSRHMYGIALEGHGSSVVTAPSGYEGLRMARQRRPHAILMDVSIHGLNGVDGHGAVEG
jgi:twitching motility two-component system response regulator PilH